MRKVLVIGSFDTKFEDYGYLYRCLRERGLEIVTIDTGVYGSDTEFQIDFDSERVAQLGGSSVEELRRRGNREYALEVMSSGAGKIVSDLFSSGHFDGIISMGGGGGTYTALTIMRELPVGVPKICISTLATKDVSGLIGEKDVILFPSVVDVAGLNSISRVVMRNAANAMYGMLSGSGESGLMDKESIALSIFGNTTRCVMECSRLLGEKEYDVLTFHAVGSGGRSMESLIGDGFFTGVMDLTTTELADELFGGICSAGPDRMTGAGLSGLPQVIGPGCLDMVNFGALDTVPTRHADRQLYRWAPDVTLMRTNEEENRQLGKVFAEKLNICRGPVIVLLPLGGLSELGAAGNDFHNPAVDQILFDSIEEHLDNDLVKIEYVEKNINTLEFARIAVDSFLSLLEKY